MIDSQYSNANDVFKGDLFRVQEKVLTIGKKYFIYRGQEQVGFCKQKMFKLKEDIRIYTDENMDRELMKIKQEQVLDFSGSFQVIDSATNELLGILKRKGLKSIIVDEWHIFNSNREQIGKIKEDSVIMGIIRRKLPFIPNELYIRHHGSKIAVIKEHFKIWGNKYDLFINNDQKMTLDRRLAVAVLLMMALFESK